MEHLKSSKSWFRMLNLFCSFIIIFNIISCRKIRTGTFQGYNEIVKLHFDKNFQHVIGEELVYDGTVKIKLKNGKEIKAICQAELMVTLANGQVLEIEYDKTKKDWVVTKVIK